jgi:hypothetical protein
MEKLKATACIGICLGLLNYTMFYFMFLRGIVDCPRTVMSEKIENGETIKYYVNLAPPSEVIDIPSVALLVWVSFFGFVGGIVGLSALVKLAYVSHFRLREWHYFVSAVYLAVVGLCFVTLMLPFISEGFAGRFISINRHYEMWPEFVLLTGGIAGIIGFACEVLTKGPRQQPRAP